MILYCLSLNHCIGVIKSVVKGTVKLEMFANNLFREFREENIFANICSAKNHHHFT